MHYKGVVRELRSPGGVTSKGYDQDRRHRPTARQSAAQLGRTSRASGTMAASAFWLTELLIARGHQEALPSLAALESQDGNAKQDGATLLKPCKLWKASQTT